MKRLAWILLVALLCLSLCACGKSEAVKNTEALITAIGEVTLDSEAAIAAAEAAYAALPPEEQQKVENTALLTEAREALHILQVKQTYIGTWYHISHFQDDVASPGFELTEAVLGPNWKPGDAPWEVVEYEGATYLYQNGERMYVSAEDVSFTSVEITADNWQEYFTIEKHASASYDAFGDMERYTIFRDFVLKEEYRDRVLPQGSVTFELSGRSGFLWSYFEEEEQQVYCYGDENEFTTELQYDQTEFSGYDLYLCYHDEEREPPCMGIADASPKNDTMEYDGRELWLMYFTIYPGDFSRVAGTLSFFDNPIYLEW